MIKKFMKGFKKNQKGFTLAELMIVIAIIGILTAIAVPIFSSSLQKAKEATDTANERVLKSVAAMYILDGGDLVDDSDDAIVWDGAIHVEGEGEETDPKYQWKNYLDEWPEYQLDKSKEWTVTIEQDGTFKIEAVKPTTPVEP